jgi:hypothetical protein
MQYALLIKLPLQPFKAVELAVLFLEAEVETSFSNWEGEKDVKSVRLYALQTRDLAGSSQ